MWGARSRAKWFEVSEGIQRARRTTGATGMADGSKPAHKARSEGVAGSRAGVEGEGEKCMNSREMCEPKMCENRCRFA